MDNLILKRKILFIIFILFIFVLFFFNNNITYGGPLKPDVIIDMNKQGVELSTKAGYEEIWPEKIIATVIQAFLGLLGIIFIVLIILAGYNWMIARGDEEKVTKAKDTLRRAVIGLIIIVGAYAISYFVFSNLPWGGGGIQKGPIK